MNKNNTQEIIEEIDLIGNNNSFLEYTNGLLKTLSFKLEPIRTGIIHGIEMYEILSVFENACISKALKSLKTTNRTYELFKIVIEFAFLKTYKTNKKYSINLFLKDLSKEQFSSDIIELESIYPINNENITFEILENNYGDLNDIAISNLLFLKQKGFKIAIDDFIPNLDFNNKSYETLEILLKHGLIPNYVKIDGKYLQNILNSKNLNSKEINNIKFIINRLKDLGIIIIGEWIQSNQDGNKAKQLGIDLFQGKYIDDNFYIQDSITGFKNNVIDLI